jgi:ribonuclease HI
MQRAVKRKDAPMKFPSNLENLVKRFPQYTCKDTIESIVPYIRLPWWTPSIDVHIEATKETAKEYHDTTAPGHISDSSTISIYTNGSGIDSNIGAAAVCPTVSITAHQHLGTESSYNVFAAELTAIHLAIRMLENVPQYTKCIIYVDSQAAIKPITNPGCQSGQSIIRTILDNVEELRRQNLNISISMVWIPGHKDILGNELVDVEAKKAAQTPELGMPFVHSPMKSSRNVVIKTAINGEWRNEWNQGKKGRHLRGITEQPESEAGLTLYNSLTTRKSVALLAQLRTAHCSLNDYLHRFGIQDDPQCECGEGCETVKHYLLRCEKYERQRDNLVKDVGVEEMSVAKLLGQSKNIKHTLHFVKTTRRFDEMHG